MPERLKSRGNGVWVSDHRNAPPVAPVHFVVLAFCGGVRSDQSESAAPRASIPSNHRPRNFECARSNAHLFSSAPSCSFSYSAQRYSYSIRRECERIFCSQRSSLRRATILTVTRIRVRVRVPAAPEYEYEVLFARTFEITGIAPWTFHHPR